jgi:hypothetical protein
MALDKSARLQTQLILALTSNQYPKNLQQLYQIYFGMALWHWGFIKLYTWLLSGAILFPFMKKTSVRNITTFTLPSLRSILMLRNCLQTDEQFISLILIMTQNETNMEKNLQQTRSYLPRTTYLKTIRKEES